MIKQIEADQKAMKNSSPNEKKAQNLFYKAYQIEYRKTPKDRLEAKKIYKKALKLAPKNSSLYKKIRNKLKKLK